jgi:hypothetical protein
MTRRVMVELTGMDGAVRTHEFSAGGVTAIEGSYTTIGLTLEDGKPTLVGLQDISFGRRRRDIAGAAAAARVVGLNGRSRMCVPSGCCHCSERLSFARRAFCLFGVP